MRPRSRILRWLVLHVAFVRALWARRVRRLRLAEAVEAEAEARDRVVGCAGLWMSGRRSWREPVLRADLIAAVVAERNARLVLVELTKGADVADRLCRTFIALDGAS